MGGRDGEDHALGDLLFGLELNFVVGPRQHPNPLRSVLIFRGHSIRQPELLGFESSAKLFERERLPESVHDPARKLAGQSQFGEFPPEQRLFIEGVGDLARLGEEAGGGQHLDAPIGVDDAGSENNGGNVSFPSGAQAENEPHRAGRQIGLVRVRDDRWIEQSGGF